MITLVIGGSGSGKSAYAESLFYDYQGAKYYVATMQVYGEEGQKKVERHRKQRAGKGFQTIEQSVELERVIERLEYQPCGVLLECMSNLVANEMFTDTEIRTVEETVRHVLPAVTRLAESVEKLVIVTNNVAEDGMPYDETTRAYVHALGDINVGLARLADQVVEVVAGIPIELKGVYCDEEEIV